MKINSNKKYVLFKVLLLLVMLIILPKTKAESQNWCWTKSMANEPTYVFDPSKGGINWGYCEKISNVIPTIHYDIEVETSSLAKSGTDSNVKIQILGTGGMTQEKVLGNKFETGSNKKFTIEDADVGDITKLIVKISGRNAFRCKNIKIFKGTSSSIFGCLKKLEPCTSITNQFICQAELLPEGDTAYEITVKTNDEEESGTTSPLLVGVIGEKGISNIQMFSESGIDTGNQVTTIIKVKDVGSVTGYQLELAEVGKWKGSYMIVKTIKNGLINQFDLKDISLTNPGSSISKFDSSPSAYNINPTSLSGSSSVSKSVTISIEESYQVNSRGTIGKSTGGFNKSFELAANNIFDLPSDDDENDNISYFSQFNSDSPISGKPETDFTASSSSTGDPNGVDVNNPYGGLLLPQESKRIINLECSQKLINPDNSNLIFGPDYPTSNVNYLRILARCPANCHRTQGQVYGTGIHPDNSPICLSALVDRAMSQYGGIISISIFPGLEKYLINKSVNVSNLIKVSNFIGHAGKSYVVSKVDNVDIIEKDIRIVDAKGNFANMGRLEIRLNGQWGTVCTIRNNDESARRICKDLGYKDGKWLTKAGSISCQSYNGQNYCGSENYKSLFSDINCSLKDTSFTFCSKKEANKNECTHPNDALISCSNVSFESGDTVPNGTLKLENNKVFNGYTIGRLEYFSNTKYLPICSNGFTPESANVACKQMGFESGEKYNENTHKFTYPADDSTGFAASQVKCLGEENTLSECNSQTVNIECSHNLDVILQCFGSKGDPSGKSQVKSSKSIEVPPSLGKLSMLKFKISCDTKGNDQKFRGDPGSVYIVSCPANCTKEKGTLWGIGLYTLDSNICQAGIHSGVISDEKGGSFAITKIWGQNYYIGLFKNGISSSELNSPFPVSFTVQALNSGWSGMWKLWKENHGGVYLEEESKIETVSNKESRILMENNKRIKYQPRSKRGNFRKTTPIKTEGNETGVSFIETIMTVKTSFTPIFEWIEIDPSHIFSDKADGSILLNENSMRPLKKYQILMRIKMTDFKGKKSFIFSNGGCNNFNVYIDESDNLIFGDPCNEAYQVNTNIQLALNDKSIVYAFYEDSNLKVVIFSEKLMKPISKTFTKNLDINNASALGIGRKSDVKDMFFYGYIDFIQIYDEEIPFLRLNDIIDGINNKAKAPISVETRNTLDKRPCISSCVNDPTPGQPGAPSPPKDADPYANSDTYSVPLPGIDKNLSGGDSAVVLASKNRLHSLGAAFTHGSNGGASSFEGGSSLTQKFVYGIDPTNTNSLAGYDESIAFLESKSTNGGITGGNLSPYTYSDSYVATYGTYDSTEQNNIESMNLECETTLKDRRFNGSFGKIFRVRCPTCGAIKRPVYGSYIYHPLSSVCKAAAHAGTINPKQSGYIIVELVSGKKIYNGSYGADGNLSGTFSSSDISFKTKAGTPPMKITCEDSPNKTPFSSAATGSKFVVVCPEKCSKNKVPIFGSEIYADMSPICLSGIHYGVVSDKGGEIEFLIEGSQSYYKGTRSFGIISKSRDAYVRSFRFIGIKSAIFYKFKEDYKNNINLKWQMYTNENSINLKSNSWGYKELKFFDNLSSKYLLINSIYHEGIIKSVEENNYGSYLILKNVEWNNGRVKSNFLFKDTKMAVFLFRYQDKENFYGVEFDISNSRSNIKLINKVDGNSRVLESKFISLNTDTWYRLTLIMENDHISIYIQTDNIRENKPIFERTIESISRGTIGFATNGNNSFYISGIMVDDFMQVYSKKLEIKNKRSWINLLKHTEPKAIKIYCQDLFRSDSRENDRCMIPQNFCRLKCDDHIPAVENILNFNCYKDCLSKIGYQKNQSIQQTQSWKPKIGDKIDFSLKGDNKYVPGNIISTQNLIENKKKKTIYIISYNDETGNIMKGKSPYPSQNIKECGSKLIRRKDC